MASSDWFLLTTLPSSHQSFVVDSFAILDPVRVAAVPDLCLFRLFPRVVARVQHQSLCARRDVLGWVRQSIGHAGLARTKAANEVGFDRPGIAYMVGRGVSFRLFVCQLLPFCEYETG